MQSISGKVFNQHYSRKALVLKVLFILLSASLILYSVSLIFCSYCGLLRMMAGATFFLVKIVFSFFITLVFKTLPYLLPPSLLYFSVCIFVKRKYLRCYLFLSLFSLYIVWFIKFVLKTDLFFLGHLIKMPEILLALIQLYIFTALILPDFMISFLGSIFFIFKSFLVFLLPDLPFRFDDFAMILALFIFTFLYLNTIVFLVKQAGKLLLRIDPSVFRNMLAGRELSERSKK